MALARPRFLDWSSQEGRIFERRFRLRNNGD